MADFWGDPIQSHVAGTVGVDSMHEGVKIRIQKPDRVAEIFLGPDETRQLAHNLERAAKWWEQG